VGGRAGLNRRLVPTRSQSHEPQVNGLQHAIEIVKDIVIREAQNVIALCGEGDGASGVPSNLFVCRVGRAIDFDGNPRLEASEVGDEAAEDNLAMESEARDLLAPEALPQAPLGARCVASEASRESG
jgi:hypothetical protein